MYRPPRRNACLAFFLALACFPVSAPTLAQANVAPVSLYAAGDQRLPAAVEGVIAAYGGADGIRMHHNAPLLCLCTVSSTSGISSAANSYECKVMQKGDKVRVEMSMLGAPLVNVFDGQHSWSESAGWVTPASPSATQQMADELEHGLSALVDLLDPATKIDLLSPQQVHGKACDVFRITTPSGRTDTFYADKRTHLIERCDYLAVDHELGGRVRHSIEYFDYRPVVGSMEPFKLVQYTADKRKAETTIKSISEMPALNDSQFVMPPESEIARLKEGPVSTPFEYAGNSIMVKARINNGPEQDFIVDTGASQTVLDSACAAGLGQQSNARFSITAGSRAIPLNYVNIPSFTVSGITIDDLPALVTDLSGMNGHPAGIIGASVLKRFLVTIDFDEKMLTLADPRTNVAAANAAVVPATPVFGGTAMSVKALLDDKPVSFLVDTGASFNNLPSSIARSLYNGSVLPTGEIYGIDGQRVNIGSVKFKSLRLGDVTIANPVFTLAPEESNSNGGGLFNAAGMGILGNPIWSQFKLTIDYRNERLLLQSDAGRDQLNKLSQQIDHAGDDYLRHKDADHALKEFESIATAAHGQGQKGAQALALAHIADCYADKFIADKDRQWLEKAEQQYEQANKLANESRNRTIEGRVLAHWALTYLGSPRNAQDLSSAQSLLTKALQKAPMDANIFAAFGTALLHQGKRAEAEKLLDRALVLDPANWQALWAKYKLYGEENRSREQNQIGTQLRHYYAGYPDVTALSAER